MSADNPTWSRHPRRIGMTDVEDLVVAARTWRGHDYRHGGGYCLAAVLDHLSWGRGLLRAQATGRVTTALRVALADLHNLAGWICFDTGQVAEAHTQFQHALTLARHARHDALITNIYYRIGRVHLHHHAPDQALTNFHLGQAAAQTSGADHALAILYANQAWAYATMGVADQALRLLDQSRTAFVSADLTYAPDWAAFFDETDLSAMVGIVHAELAQTVHPRHIHSAIPALSHAATHFTDDMARSKTLALISLATCHFLDDDTDHATTIGTRAVELATMLTSARPADRMRPLQRQADRYPNNPEARHLSHLITTLAAA
jgi:tetratricopeptide (TPR) repeat protein